MIICARCTRENLDHYKFCLGCGEELTRAVPMVTAAAPDLKLGPPIAKTLVNPEADRSAMNIAGAQTLLREFVDAHGTTPAPENSHHLSSTPCPACTNPIPVDFVFCGRCGHKLEQRPFDAHPAAPTDARPVAQAPHENGAPSTPAARGQLVLIRPDGTEGGTMPLFDGEVVIGRCEGALFETDVYLSPRHATLTLGEDYLIVADLGSLNGIFVRMIAEEEIETGEMFRIGQELLRFDVIAPPTPLDDGTELMGSPNPGFWGRLSVVVGRDMLGSAFPLFGDAVVLGRERGDILFPEDGYVSGTHARVAHRDGKFFLQDLGSSNGTFVRVRGDRAVKTGAFVLMGQQLFRISYE